MIYWKRKQRIGKFNTESWTAEYNHMGRFKWYPKPCVVSHKISNGIINVCFINAFVWTLHVNANRLRNQAHSPGLLSNLLIVIRYMIPKIAWFAKSWTYKIISKVIQRLHGPFISHKYVTSYYVVSYHVISNRVMLYIGLTQTTMHKTFYYVHM